MQITDGRLEVTLTEDARVDGMMEGLGGRGIERAQEAIDRHHGR